MSLTAVDERPKVLRIELAVRDQELIGELLHHEDESERCDYALSALRIGMIALRQARGVVDADAVREEGIRLIGDIREVLTANAKDIASTLKIYFDPTDGHLPQRLDRLIKKDGELQSLLAHHLDGDESAISRTLAKHLGTESPLLRLLSPEEQDGVIAALEVTIKEALNSQRQDVLSQFDLNEKDSALSRLVANVTDANGQLRKDLAEDVEKFHSEFSLDNKRGALYRLVRSADKARRKIDEQFALNNKDSALCQLIKLIEDASKQIDDKLTLDNENSPLCVLRKGLTEIVERLERSNAEFQKEVKATLDTFKARKEEAARSTRHGCEFQDLVGDVLQAEAQKTGDIAESTGAKPGAIPRCKTGDYVIGLGMDSAAPGARIVVEAKDDKCYTLRSALEEIEEARKNREAQVGLFVFARKTAPRGLEPFCRHDRDIVLIWDPDDATTDIYLRAGLSLARALLVRERIAAEGSKDTLALKKAVHGIAREITALANISKWAQTVKSSGEKIGRKAEAMKKKLTRHLKTLEKHLQIAAGDSVSDTANGLFECAITPSP